METFFEELGTLYGACCDLRNTLERLRKEMNDDQWDELAEGPWQDLLAEALEVEDRLIAASRAGGSNL